MPLRRPLLAALIALLAAPAAAQGWTPPPAKKGFAYPDCYCTNRGERVEKGDLACLRVDGREFTARCGMSQNNPVWRKVEDGCAPRPSASLLQRLQRLQPG